MGGERTLSLAPYSDIVPACMVGWPMTLEDEAKRLNELLVSERVARIWRHRTSELVIEFESGTRLFVDSTSDRELEFSVT